MKEKSKNALWGCLGLLFVATFLFCLAYGMVSLFQNLVGIRPY